MLYRLRQLHNQYKYIQMGMSVTSAIPRKQEMAAAQDDHLRESVESYTYATNNRNQQDREECCCA